jgi:DNA sulfur modification protein DndD
MLELLSIELKNFRQYEGPTTIDLDTTAGQHINVVEGENGAGKSNLLNAITLCFYDQEQHQQGGEGTDKLPYVTESKLDGLGVGEYESGYIEIVVGTDAPEYIFRREFNTFNVQNGYNDDTKKLQLQRRVGNEYKIVDHPVQSLNQILPARVKEYFIFDGESLTDFFDERHKQKVKDAIVDVSHIGLLNSSIDHLETVRKEIRRKAGDVQGRPAEIEKEKRAAEADLEEFEDEHDKYEGQIAELNEEIGEIRRKLRGAADEDVQDLLQQQDDIEDTIERKKPTLEDVRAETAEHLVKSGPAIYTASAIEYTRDIIKELEAKGQLPPKIQDWFIDELIERGECICGTPISDGATEHGHLIEMKENVAAVSAENLGGKAELPRVIRDGNEWAERVRDGRGRMRELRDEIDELDKDLAEVKSTLQSYDVPDVDVGKLATQDEDLEEDKAELNQKIGRLENQIEEQKKEIDRLEEKLKKELREQGRHNEILDQVEFAEQAEAEMEKIRETILNRIRSETEANMNEYFNQLIWKSENYTITLDDQYHISVSPERSETNRIGSLSAGETQILALSFMAALSDISGFDAPVVIDTPLGRISGDNRRRIAQNLPNYLEDTQVTFLMTDKEYADDVKRFLVDRVANKYLLDFDGGTTEVKVDE